MPPSCPRHGSFARARSRPRALRRALLVALAAAGSAPTRAHAQDPAAPISLAVEVPPECPTDLAIQILTRTPRTRLASPGEPARRVGVRIVQEERRFRGAVALDGLDGAPVVRQVEGPSCDEVTAALALITALAIDPEASMSPITPPPPPPPPPPAVPVAPPPRRSEPESLEILPVVEAGFGVASGLAPRVIAGGVLMLELGIPREDPLVLLRAGAGYWTNGQIAVERPDGTANAAAVYRAVLARVEGCVALVPVDRLRIAPCATFDVGSLAVEGSVDGIITEGFEDSQVWAAPGPALRLGWNPAGPLTLGLDGALTFPLRRDTYVFEQPDQVAHEVPPVAARTQVYLGLQLR